MIAILKIIEKLKKGVHDPMKFIAFAVRNFGGCLSDETYTKLLFRAVMHYKLNLEHPTTYNEKLQWLKLYAFKPEYTMLVDKVNVKKYVAERIGEEHIIPTLGVWKSADDIDFDTLPSQFVLKCSHNSGGLVICKDKEQLDIRKAKRILGKGLKYNFYKLGREKPYRDVPRRILAEKYMVDESGTELKDYKFFCSDGEVKMLFVASSRPHDTRFDFYDTDFRHLPFKQGHPWATVEIKKPQGFEQMKQIAAILSQGLPHVRVDLYNINGAIYFGELTFYHDGGMVPFDPMEWDEKLGGLIVLPSVNKPLTGGGNS